MSGKLHFYLIREDDPIYYVATRESWLIGHFMSQDIRYSTFIQAVRRYRPSNLLPYLAAHSAEREKTLGPAAVDEWFPWAISAIAKESILKGSEFRDENIDSIGLRKLVSLFNRTYDRAADQSPASLLTPIVYEQFPYQESIFEEMARTHALFVHNEPEQPPIPWADALGIGLDEAMRASHILHAWVQSNAGRYEATILDLPHFQEVFTKIAPRTEIVTTAELLSADIPDLRLDRTRADAKTSVPPHLERYAFNPLKARPLVDLGSAGVWAPQSMLVSRAFLGQNLYYRGLAQWGRPFADILGKRTESYVGRQLKLLKGIELFSEIEYKKSQFSVDWIWVSRSAIILVECKAARLTLDAQAGGESLPDVLQRYLGEARVQIDRTAKLIREQHSAFEDVPKDRPIIGVVTTAEPFYLAGTPFSGFMSSGEIPVTTMSLRDLEFLVGLPEKEAAQLVIKHVHPGIEGGRFGGSFDEETMRHRNPILEKAWDHFGFIDRSLET